MTKRMARVRSVAPKRRSDLHASIENRFGVLPNFFRLAPEVPEIAHALWGFAKFAYLDLPLPSLFKERLFVHVSRFCEVRYCLARHLCFLVGRGRPAGDAKSPCMTTEQAIALLRKSFTPHLEIEKHAATLRRVKGPLAGDIEPGSDLETSLFALCTAIFVSPEKSQSHLPLLLQLFGAKRREYLLLYIGFIRMAHYWTQVHPELREEEDLLDLMKQLEDLSWGLAWDPQAGWSTLGVQITEELSELKQRARRKS